MTIDQGRESSIKGGYNREQRLTSLGIMKSVHEMLWDINFWKCLAKNEGWVDIKKLGYTCFAENLDKGTGKVTFDEPIKDYIYYWHRTIDIIADSKTIEEAFELATN